MPLKTIYFDLTPVTDITPLQTIPSLQVVILPENAEKIEALKKLPNLQRLSFYFDPKVNGPSMTAAEFWKFFDANSTWTKRLRDAGIKFKTLKPMIGGIWEMDLSKAAITNLAILKGAPIHRLNLYGNPVSDLSPLRGMAIRELVLNDTEVTDLSPLQGMPLEMLTLVGTKVADITVLHGMSIRDLHLSNTQVTDMSPLRGMPLDRLRLGGTPVTDLSPLAEAKGLTSLTLPPNARNIEFLRVFPRLERLGFKDEAGTGYLPDKTAAEFWKEYDARKR